MTSDEKSPNLKDLEPPPADDATLDTVRGGDDKRARSLLQLTCATGTHLPEVQITTR
ncbi:MAG TPA: hypothetical protein VKA84_12170 [Gemmatimonadaceae bacterium]|nr:hypothetical protein [Gemmatimonadaceae bacterium]